MIGLKRLSLFTALLAWLVIALGAFTRLSDAGLGCPDWPGCYGHISVINHLAASPHKAWVEMIHRYFAGSLALFVIITAFLCVSNAAKYGVSYLILGVLLFALVVYQALLGMWTVTLKLLPIVVTQHLLGGMSILGLLWTVYLKSYFSLLNKKHNSYLPCLQKSPMTKRLAIIAVLLVFLQIALGAWTSTNYAALSCISFPFCSVHGVVPDTANQLVLPSEMMRQMIHMVHRFGALFVTLYLALFSSFVLFSCGKEQRLQRSICVLWLVLLLQLALGITNVLLQWPLLLAVLHNMAAALLLCAVIYVNVCLRNRGS